MATKTSTKNQQSIIIYTLLKSDIAFTPNFPHNPIIRRSSQFIMTSNKITDIESYIKKLVISTNQKPKDKNIDRKFIGYNDLFDLSKASILTNDFIRNNIIFTRTLVYNHNDLFLQSKEIDEFHNIEIYYIVITTIESNGNRSVYYFNRITDKLEFEIFEDNISKEE